MQLRTITAVFLPWVGSFWNSWKVDIVISTVHARSPSDITEDNSTCASARSMHQARKLLVFPTVSMRQ
jgi:hypothetical protein